MNTYTWTSWSAYTYTYSQSTGKVCRGFDYQVGVRTNRWDYHYNTNKSTTQCYTQFQQMILATMVYIQWNPDERGEALSDSNCTLIFTMVTAHKMFVIPILNSIYTTLDFRKKNRIEIKNITVLL